MSVTGVSQPLVPVPPIPGRARPRLLRAPVQGWWSLFALVLMLLVTGVVADSVGLVGHEEPASGHRHALTVLIVFGGLVGTVLARSSVGIVRAHLVGAVVGSAIILVATAGAISDAQDLVTRVRDLDEAVSAYVGDVVRARTANGLPVLMLALGAIFWTTGQFAAFSVFRHGRAGPPITSAGVLLFVATAIGSIQLLALVTFTAAAMVLIMRLNLARQQLGWSRRHIADVRDVSRLFMRTGLVFASIALIAAVGLAGIASGAPLSHAWRALDDRILELSIELERMLGGVGVGPPRATSLFGHRQEITGVWEDSDTPMLRTESSDGKPHYLRGATYNRFDGRSWWQSVPRTYGVPAGAPLLADSSEGADLFAGSRRNVTLTITSTGLEGPTLVAPAQPDTVAGRSTEVRTSDVAGPLLTIDLNEPLVPGGSLALDARVPVLFPERGGTTGNELALAGRDYPPDIVDAGYTLVEEGSIGPLTLEAMREVRQSLPPSDRDDPFRLAVAVQDHLRDPKRFEYRTNIQGYCDPGQPVPECLLDEKVGYCQQYATTMVMMLRSEDIPARYVQGFLPGRKVEPGVHEVDRGSLHAWAEVYFPEYGWIQFDPTPGQEERGSEATRIEDGPKVAESTREPGDPEAPATPDPSDALPEPSASPEASPEVGPVAGADDGGFPGALVLVLGGIIAALVVVILAVARLRRTPAGESDLAYRGIVGLATRLGYAPRPSQTVYEYMGALSEVVPTVREDLSLVAQAQVRAVYGRHPADGAGLTALRAAYSHVRLALLRLLVRRGRHRGRRAATRHPSDASPRGTHRDT